MGYNANTVDVDFTIPADKIDAALEAVNAAELWNDWCGQQEIVYDNLIAAVEDNTSFECCEINDGGFSLGWHGDKYVSATDTLLAALAPFANEGSYVRFLGEDDSLFGYRVVDGKLRSERGEYIWKLDDDSAQQ